METCMNGRVTGSGESRSHLSPQTSGSRPALAHWITPHEVEALRDALSRGCLPPDLSGKLNRLAKGDLSGQFIEQNCRLFAALIAAIEDGSFRGAGAGERDRLLRVLAYVRKDDDAIPDYKPGGFADDQREIRAATVDLRDLIQGFKLWRLRNQVPAMWPDRNARAPQLHF
jgi:hypothetical protein